MKKVILSLVIVAAATFSANAQDKSAQTMKDLTFSVGVDAGFPVSPSGSKGFIIGGDVQGEYAVSPEVGITLSAGYLSYKPKGASTSFGSVPVLGGIRYYFSDRKVYALAQAGVTISTETGGSSVFTYAPGIGYYITPQFDLGVKYSGSSSNGVSSGAIMLRAAYNF